MGGKRLTGNKKSKETERGKKEGRDQMRKPGREHGRKDEIL